MKQPPTRLADVALLATLLSSAVTTTLLVISEVFHYVANRPFGIPPLISYLLVGFLLLCVTEILYSKLRKTRKSRGAKGIDWRQVFIAFLTTLIPVLAYLIIRTRTVPAREWLAVFYVSVLFAILIPHLLARVISLVISRISPITSIPKLTSQPATPETAENEKVASA